MPEERPAPPAPNGPAAPAWEEALDDLERSLRFAVRAVESLRQRLGGGAEPRLAVVAPEAAAPIPPPRKPEPPPARPADGKAHSPFERLWERLERERLEKEQPAQEPQRRGLDLLPSQYLMTVEDRERAVDLIPLHRALQGLVGAQEVQLVSFANGVPVVSLRADREVDFDQLRAAVEIAMDRRCEVIPQDNGRVYLRLRPVDGQGA